MIGTRPATRTISPSAALLLQFCRKPGSADYPMANIEYDPSSALSVVKSVFPDIEQQVKGKRVVDFGCGGGYQAVAYAKAGASSVVGIEIAEHLAAICVDRVQRENLTGIVRIERQLSEQDSADIIVSQNSFEHFLEPEAILWELQRALAPGGRIYITFGPPWFAPTGTHMGFFCRLPWLQLLFPESTVMEVRSFFRSDGATTYREAGLGHISIARFERVIRSCGLRMSWSHYDCIKGLNFLRYLPGVRELAINRVSCILESAG